MQPSLLLAACLMLLTTGQAAAQDEILINSKWGSVTAELADNAAARALAQRLPLNVQMRDHLRQEKTGALSTPLPQSARQLEFATGDLGLWGSDDFVIYYRNGQVPQPGIVVLGKVKGNVAIFDRPGPVSVELSRINKGSAQ